MRAKTGLPKPAPHRTQPQPSSLALSLARFLARARNSDSFIATRGSSLSDSHFASSLGDLAACSMFRIVRPGQRHDDLVLHHVDTKICLGVHRFALSLTSASSNQLIKRPAAFENPGQIALWRIALPLKFQPKLALLSFAIRSDLQAGGAFRLLGHNFLTHEGKEKRPLFRG